MKKRFTMREAVEDQNLFGTILAGKTWEPWRVILIAAMGEKLTWWERRTFKRFTGRSHEPGQMVEELVAVAGRRSGKSRAASVLAAYMAAMVDHAVGERLKVLFLAKDQRQAAICHGYVAGIFESVPLLRAMVINKTQDTISLSNGIDCEIKAASAAGVRGFSAVCVIADEAAFWTTDSASANADTEILNAVRPSLATTAGPLLILSSRFARRGEVWDLFDKHYGLKGDPGILVLHGTSQTFNPSFDKAVVDRALARNPIAARAEWLGEFRSDLEGYVSLDTLRACTGPLTEWQPISGVSYTAGIDAAMGSGEDSLALAIGHHDDASDKVQIDFIKEWRPPFSPTAVLKEVASHCRRYNVTEIVGDRYAEKFVAEMLFAERMRFRRSDRDTSGNFGELLPMLNSHEVWLPNLPALIDQLASLQAKPSSRGRTHYGHGGGSNAHDDLAAAVAIVATHCSLSIKQHVQWTMGVLPSFGDGTGDSSTGIDWRAGMTAMTDFLKSGFSGSPAQGESQPQIGRTGRSFADYAAIEKMKVDAGVTDVMTDYETYHRANEMRGKIRINGEPPSWEWIMNKIREEQRIANKRW